MRRLTPAASDKPLLGWCYADEVLSSIFDLAQYSRNSEQPKFFRDNFRISIDLAWERRGKKIDLCLTTRVSYSPVLSPIVYVLAADPR